MQLMSIIICRRSGFLEHNDFYDNYPRDIKVFAGEYAAHDPEINIAHVSKNNWKAGISEAAFFDRN